MPLVKWARPQNERWVVIGARRESDVGERVRDRAWVACIDSALLWYCLLGV